MGCMNKGRVAYKWNLGDAHFAQVRKCVPYGNVIRYTTKNAKASKAKLRKKLIKYYRRANNGGSY